jgi:L-arabinonolactonase
MRLWLKRFKRTKETRAVADIERIVECRNVLGEGPVWCPVERVLWWINITAPELWRFDPATKRSQSWPLPKLVGSIALRKGGGFLIAFRGGIATLDRPGGEATWLPMPGLDFNEIRFNDGKTDRAGRFWVGAMDRKLSRPIGDLYCVDGAFHVNRVEAGVTVSNGIGWSPDNRTLYHTDTPSCRLFAYDYDIATGAAANRRVFAEVAPGHGGPDGMTVDSDGFVWSAQFDRWCINRYDPKGKLERTIRVPVQRPTSVMFGGPDLSTLFITTATLDLDEKALAAQPWAGSVLAMDAGVKGLAEVRYG